jgi:hypothetical protein
VHDEAGALVAKAAAVARNERVADISLAQELGRAVSTRCSCWSRICKRRLIYSSINEMMLRSNSRTRKHKTNNSN